MSFSVDGDPSASVHVRKGSQRSRDDFGVMLRRGDAHREYWCVQWRSSDASETLHCGPFSLVRAPADQYSLRVDDVRNETILALTHGPSKQVRLTRRAEAQDSLAGVVAQRPRG